MSDTFIGEEDIVTKIPYDVRVVPMRFKIPINYLDDEKRAQATEDTEQEKLATIEAERRPGESYRLDRIIKDANVPVDPYDRDLVRSRYDPIYIQNVIFVKKKEL